MLYYSYCLFLFVILYSLFKKKYYKIILYIIFPYKGKGGPFSLGKYIKIAIEKWNKNITLSNRATLFYRESISLKLIVLLVQRKNTFLWLEKPYYINLIKNNRYSAVFSKIVYGPIVTPIHWFNSPINKTYEKYWCLVMKKIKAYAVHSKRVKNHIINYTKCYLFYKKYIILKPCIEIKDETLYITRYYRRLVDILVYIKYADVNKKDDEIILLNYLRKRKYNIQILRYGNHSKDALLRLANNSKFVIYFSFYDTGALSLLEMKLMGVWPISHQKEFIETGYGSYLKELDTNIAVSLQKIDSIMKIKFDPIILSQNVIDYSNCRTALYNTIKYIG